MHARRSNFRWALEISVCGYYHFLLPLVPNLLHFANIFWRPNISSGHAAFTLCLLRKQIERPLCDVFLLIRWVPWFGKVTALFDRSFGTGDQMKFKFLVQYYNCILVERFGHMYVGR